MLGTYGVATGDPFVVLHLGSNRPSRRWPVERFEEVVDFLVETYGVKIICIGVRQEKQLVVELLGTEKDIGISDHIVDMTGKTTIKQLMYIISRASLFIGHSTGPLQIAYMVGTPTVSLWGASSPVIWGPWCEKEKHVCIKADLGCIHCEQDVCPKGTLECMQLISVDMVINEVAWRFDKCFTRRENN